jgi:hypothetical protein
VKQNGVRKFFLSEMLLKHIPLKSSKKLHFWIEDISVNPPYKIYWKVLNRGEEAERRNCIRGQIIDDHWHRNRDEQTSFRGDHVVECYCVKDGVVVAKDRIHVPIEADASNYE